MVLETPPVDLSKVMTTWLLIVYTQLYKFAYCKESQVREERDLLTLWPSKAINSIEQLREN